MSIFTALASSVQAFSVAPTPVVRSLHRTLRASSLRMADDEFTYTPKSVFMFPGQGAQAIGMGVETAETVEMVEMVGKYLFRLKEELPFDVK